MSNWRSAVQGHEEDKIIFLGEYVDRMIGKGFWPARPLRSCRAS